MLAARLTAKGVIRALFAITIGSAVVGSLLIAASGENPMYILTSFTAIESPPVASVPVGALGAFFMALSGMLMISTIVAYTLTLKSSEDLSRKLEGLEAEVREVTLAALEEVRRSLEEDIAESRAFFDKRVREGVHSIEEALEEAIRGISRISEEAVTTIDELMKARIEELKKSLKEG